MRHFQKTERNFSGNWGKIFKTWAQNFLKTQKYEISKSTAYSAFCKKKTLECIDLFHTEMIVKSFWICNFHFLVQRLAFPIFRKWIDWIKRIQPHVPNVPFTIFNLYTTFMIIAIAVIAETNVEIADILQMWLRSLFTNSKSKNKNSSWNVFTSG